MSEVNKVDTTMQNSTEETTMEKVKGAISHVMVVSGLAILIWSGWLFYQQQVEAYSPPPARILSVADLEATETAMPPPAPRSTSTPDSSTSNTDKTVATPTEVVTASDTKPEIIVNEAISAVDDKLREETALSSDPSVHTPPSLEDNPLVVDIIPGQEQFTRKNPDMPPITRMVAETVKIDTNVVDIGWEQSVKNGVTQNVWSVANYAAGWHKSSARPTQGGNIVLSGHHNIKGKVFRYLVDIGINDVITLYAGDKAYDYVVEDKFIVKDKGAPPAARRAYGRWIGQFKEERLTIVTCWPYSTNTHRVIVIAKPVASSSPADIITDSTDTESESGGGLTLPGVTSEQLGK